MEKPNKVETITKEKLCSLLATDPEKGLTEREAQKRLEENGKNKIAEKPKDPWYKSFFRSLTTR